jgi:sodium transport system ATP-binding protein
VFDAGRSGMGSSSNAIDVIDLTKHFSSVVALDGVGFSVSPGEVVGLLGPNGAGKTTCIRIMAGILAPSGGTVVVKGHDVTRDPMRVRASLGFLSGSTALYARLTVREVLRYFGRLHGMPRHALSDRIARYTELLDLGPFIDRRCGTLSSGQRQRANLARAFLHDPPVLVLDEPTSSLDVVSGHFILERIEAARNEGKAVLFSTHVMSEAEHLCDRIVMLHEGRVLDIGTEQEILSRSGAPSLTATFLSYASPEGRGPQRETSEAP